MNQQTEAYYEERDIIARRTFLGGGVGYKVGWVILDMSRGPNTYYIGKTGKGFDHKAIKQLFTTEQEAKDEIIRMEDKP